MDPSQIDIPLTRASVVEAHERIKAHIHRTPSLTSQTLDKFASTPRNVPLEGIKDTRKPQDPANPKIRFVFKCENLQKGGAFKIRYDMLSLEA